MALTLEKMDEWERQGWLSTESALNEYTPPEFWSLLDAHRALLTRYERLLDWAEERVSTDNGDANYMCPASRVQNGFPTFKKGL